MKSINKKIKSIYLLAIMAIISVCLAVFPVFKTETVKAEDAELSMTGAYVEFSKAHGPSDFALMFQAEITKTFVDANAGQNVKFGMAIGPKANLDGITTYEGLVNLGNKVKVLNDLVDINDITFDEGVTTYAYEAGTYFNKYEAGYQDFTDAQWKGAYTKDLTAIPFYTVENEAPVLKTSITKNASQVVFDTFMEETALPANSELRTVSDAAFGAITGNTLTQGYGSDEQIYLNMDTKQFFANFFRSAWTYTDFNFLQPWVPSAAYTSGAFANYGLGTDKGRPAYFAGGELLKAYPESGAGSMENCKLSSTIFDNFDQITKLIPGETYRLIYKKADGTYIWNKYIAATQIFGIVTNSLANAAGSTFYLAQNLKETSSRSVYHFFMYDLIGSNLYMPYSRTQATTEYNKNNYDGYYVLMSDWVLDGINGMNINMMTGNGVTARAVAPSKQTVARATLSAFRQVSDYIQQFNTTLPQAAFTGTFDGRGCTIDASFGRGGLFGYIDGGTIKNLNIKADFYYYSGSSTVTYATDSYMEKAATLAEVIENATIENVSIELVENAPVTFNKGQKYLDGGKVVTSTTLPDMNNVPGIVASQGIYNSTLKNVIVKCDSLKDAGNSLQNYRAALNLQGNKNTLENVFVVGSSYTNMSIEETADAYILTLSAPEGIEPGEYVNGGTIPASYFDMARDMFKYMRNVDPTAKTIKVKFIAEATKKFATEEDFQAYLNSEAGAEAKATFIATKKWTTDTEGNLVWKEPVAGDAGKTCGQYQIIDHETLKLAEKPAADKTTNFFSWANFDGYNPSVTYAG